MALEKIDFKKELKAFYKPSGKVVTEVDVPAFSFIKIDGQGDPNTSSAYSQAVEALFGVAYTLKFMIKRGELAIDYGVMPLEGLWWADDSEAFRRGERDSWQWTSMIMQPSFVTAEMVGESVKAVGRKKDLPALGRLRFETYEEGPAVQILHTGPFSEEGPVIEKLHNYIEAQGFILSGRHHEIYLSDFRRTAPEKLKTVIRQPFRRK